MRRTYRFWIVLAAVLFCFSSGLVWAQGGFGIKPAQSHSGYFNYSLQPGETVGDAVHVSNTSREPVGVKLYVLDARTARNGGSTFPGAEGSQNTGAGKWVAFPSGQLVLDPGIAGTIPFTVTVPPATPPGEYLAGIVAEDMERTAAAGGTGQLNVQVVNRTVIPVKVTVPGPTQIEFGIASVESRVDESGSRFFVTLQNAGNVALKVRGGDLEVLDATGRVIGSQPIRFAGQFLARDTAVPEVEFDQVLPPGAYGVRASVDYGGDAPATWESAFEVTQLGAKPVATAIDKTFHLPEVAIETPAVEATPTAGATPAAVAPTTAEPQIECMYAALILLIILLILLGIVVFGVFWFTRRR